MLCIEAEVENNNALTAEQKEIENKDPDELMEKEEFGLLDSKHCPNLVAVKYLKTLMYYHWCVLK